MESLNGAQLIPGMKVWADSVLGFPGDVMLAEVIATDLKPGFIGFHFGKVCRTECVTIRHLSTAGAPVPKGQDAWVTDWPANKLLAV